MVKAMMAMLEPEVPVVRQVLRVAVVVPTAAIPTAAVAVPHGVVGAEADLYQMALRGHPVEREAEVETEMVGVEEEVEGNMEIVHQMCWEGLEVEVGQTEEGEVEADQVLTRLAGPEEPTVPGQPVLVVEVAELLDRVQ
jgi:hypothetical protein